MPFNEANINGSISEGNQFLDFNPLLILEEALKKNNWDYTELEKSGTSLLKCKISNGSKFQNIAFSVGKIQNQEEGRNPNEKRIQLSPKNTSLAFEINESANSKYAIIGVYKREIFDDTILCGWPKDAIKNENTQISVRVKIDLIAEALINGFAKRLNDANQMVCAFRPEFIHYYLLNKDEIHNGSVVGGEFDLTHRTQNLNKPLNQILYGPPGTGKTYNVINHALTIIKGNTLEGKTRKEIKDEFNRLVSEGQIQFVTFHQSYSYEEFVEGIKPTINNGNVEYKIEDGIFKKLCQKAQENKLLNIGDHFSNLRGGILTISRVNNEVIEISREEGSIITLPSDLVYGLLKLLINKTINFENIQSREKNGSPLQNLLEKKYDKYIFGYDSVLKALLEFMISKEAPNNSNYVLIIDEINRGNISKIFGELITLIEDSKRIGASEELRAKLTYSGAGNDEMFGIPSNVYIIGTMNTADRSITNIDTALRRRFVFEEFPPIPNHFSIGSVQRNGKQINLQGLLKTINTRIEYLLDKDHLIGHSYFMNINTWDSLCDKFRNNIIPLLQEYFYNDWEKIRLVLGDNDSWGKEEVNKFIQKKTYSKDELFGKGNNMEDEYDEEQYFINPKLVNRDYSSLSEELFMKGFKEIAD